MLAMVIFVGAGNRMGEDFIRAPASCGAPHHGEPIVVSGKKARPTSRHTGPLSVVHWVAVDQRRL